jgi:phosphatidylserine/phosphatidylglycerophosphate/cardiolipin synthase-like enzyme
VVRKHKGADHTLAALKSIRAARPGGYRLFVITDNLSANKTPAIRRWAKRALPFTSGTSVSVCPVFSAALRAGHDFGWRSGTDVNATRPLL